MRSVERSAASLVLEVEGVDFSVLDSLQEVLNRMNEVEYAGTSLLHPLYPTIRFVLRVKPGQDAQKVLLKGLVELQEAAATLRTSIERATERAGEVPGPVQRAG
ncbi:MAG: RpoL/Rpb11 RNA polymerase subunit family protein [Nitrososphaerota archaeon]|nr:RpoL/Rpb11 RNA polymerase subunit family protein [Nitrososphaerota archaeon]